MIDPNRIVYEETPAAREGYVMFSAKIVQGRFEVVNQSELHRNDSARLITNNMLKRALWNDCYGELLPLVAQLHTLMLRHLENAGLDEARLLFQQINKLLSPEGK